MYLLYSTISIILYYSYITQFVINIISVNCDELSCDQLFARNCLAVVSGCKLFTTNWQKTVGLNLFVYFMLFFRAFCIEDTIFE